jgi:methyl-accepting chemotaxis protein
MIAPVQKSMVTNTPIVAIVTPIKNGAQTTAFLGLVVDLGTFSQSIVEGVKIGATGYPFVTDGAGMVFAHPNKNMILTYDITKQDWGRQVMAARDGEMISYEFEGKDKILLFLRNAQYNFISMATMFVSDINESARAMALIMIIFAIIGVAVAGAVIYMVIARRLNPLVLSRDVLAAMASGDLTKRYDGRLSSDEIGEIAGALNGSLDQFEKLVSDLIVSSENLSQAVSEIASGNENLSQRTSEQASSLEEIASTMQEATSTIAQNAENAVEANTVSEQTSALAENGGRLIQDSVRAINEINDSSKKISEIISVINEISFQTNLLALNAAVEAARAGDQGRGFAVVAGEVRNLAQRAAGASKDIGQLINTSLEKVTTGTRLVTESGQSLEKIIDSIRKVSQLISEIAAASQEQKQGVDQIAIAISELDNMTQQNSALVEETASASEEMANQAQELLALVRQFKIRDSVGETSQRERHKEIHVTGKIAKGALKKAAKPAAPRKAAAKTSETGNGADALKDDGFVEF